MLYWHSIKTIFFTLFLSPLTEQHPRRPACSSLFHSWVNPLIFSLPLVLFSSCSLSSSTEIMWSVWSFCSTVRRVNQSEGISIRLWAIFSKKPVKPCLHCRRFWASSPFHRFSLSASGFWDSSRNPLKRHDDAMNECFADQPSQPQQRRINLRNPLKRRGDERRDERVLRRS